MRWYAANADGEITDLILRDFTGDLYEYGIITSAKETSTDMELSGSYTYLLNGEKRTLTTMNQTIVNTRVAPASTRMYLPIARRTSNPRAPTDEET